MNEPKSSPFQDMPPVAKVLLLLGFSFISSALFTLLAQQLNMQLFGVDFLDVSDGDVDPEKYPLYRRAAQLSSFFVQVGLHLLPALTFFQLVEKKGIAFSRYKERPVRSAVVAMVIMGGAALWGMLIVGQFNIELVDQFSALREQVDEWNESYHTWQEVILSGGWESFVFSLLTIGIVAPLAEELFYRAGIQRYLLRTMRNPFWPILITASLFALLHFEFDGLLVRILMGLVLGFAFYMSGSLWVSVALHAAYNIMGVCVEFLIGWMENHTGHAITRAFENISDILPVIGLAVTVGIMYLIYRNKINMGTPIKEEPVLIIRREDEDDDFENSNE